MNAIPFSDRLVFSLHKLFSLLQIYMQPKKINYHIRQHPTVGHHKQQSCCRTDTQRLTLLLNSHGRGNSTPPRSISTSHPTCVTMRTRGPAVSFIFTGTQMYTCNIAIKYHFAWQEKKTATVWLQNPCNASAANCDFILSKTAFHRFFMQLSKTYTYTHIGVLAVMCKFYYFHSFSPKSLVKLKLKVSVKMPRAHLNNFMSEPDLNQAKSKGGCRWSVRAVSALHLCSLSLKFAQHSRAAGKTAYMDSKV